MSADTGYQSHPVVSQAIGGFTERPNYKQLEQLIESARQAKLEIFVLAKKASSLDREAVSYLVPC